MAFIYTYTDVLAAVDAELHSQSSRLNSVRGTINRGARAVLGKADLRSAIRRVNISPAIYDDFYSYPCPADMKDNAIIDIPAQVNRSERYYQTSPEQFDARKKFDTGMVAFDDRDNNYRRLLLSTAIKTDTTILSDCESTTGWVASGDATNLAVDLVDYINGSGALSFDSTAGSGVITLTATLPANIDLTPYKGRELFIALKCPTNVAASLITSVQLKWGSSSANYWSASATSTAELLAFYQGWMYVRFIWPATATGTPDITKVNYVQLNINLSAGTAGTGWHLDFISAREGAMADTIYYSKYPWTTSTGVYIKDSTASDGSDYIVADATEFEMIVGEAAMYGARELRFPQNEINQFIEDQDGDPKYQRPVGRVYKYKMSNPSQRMLLQTSYHNFASVTGDDDITIMNHDSDLLP